MMFCVTSLFAFGSSDKNKKENIIRVTGTVRLVGTGLFNDIVITGSEHEWYIHKDESDKLFNLQQQKVIVEGIEEIFEMTFASGLSAGTRRNLRNVKILSIE